MKATLLPVAASILVASLGLASAPALGHPRGDTRRTRATSFQAAIRAVPYTTTRVRVANVAGYRMDRATRTLHNQGLRVNEECSGLFGCIIKSQWWICAQLPRAGRLVPKYSVVAIYGERRGDC